MMPTMLPTTIQPDTITALTLAFGIPGGYEWIILLVIALLIFGRRLPEVGKWLGQGIVEFKRGIKGIDDDIENATNGSRPPERIADQSQSGQSQPSERERQTVPRSDGQEEEKHHLDR